MLKYFFTVIALLFSGLCQAQETDYVSLNNGPFYRDYINAGGSTNFTFTAPCGPTGNTANPTCSPNGTTFMGYENDSSVATINGGLKSTAANTFPFQFPATTTDSWTFVTCFRVDDLQNLSFSQAVDTNCTVGGNCTGGVPQFRYITISNWQHSSTFTQNNEFQIDAEGANSANTHLFLPTGFTPPHTGIWLTPAKSYCAFLSQYGQNVTGAYAGLAGLMSLAVVDTNGNNAPGSPIVTSTLNQGTSSFYQNNVPTPYTVAQLGAFFTAIGTQSINTTNTTENGMAGPFGVHMMLYGMMPNDTTGIPSLSIMSALTTGAVDPVTWAENGSYFGAGTSTCASSPHLCAWSIYKLNDVGTWADSSPNANANSWVAVNNSLVPIAADPILVPSALRVNSQGPYDVFRVTPGLTGSGATGTINLSGTVDPTAAGSSHTNVQCQVTNGNFTSGWTDMIMNGNSWSGTIGSVPVNVGANAKAYTENCRFKYSTAYVYTGAYPVYVGLKLGIWGQSEKQVLFGGGGVALGVGTGNSLQPLDGFSQIFTGTTQLANAAPVLATNSGYAHYNFGFLNSNNTTGVAASIGEPTADGITSMINAIQANSLTLNWPVQIVNFSVSGHPVDSWTYDNVPFTQSIAGSTTTYSPTLAPTNTITGANFVGGFNSSIKEGSLNIYDSGVNLIATDTVANPTHYNGTCTWTTPNTFMTCVNVTGVVNGQNVNAAAGLAAGTTVSSIAGLQVNLNQATTVNETSQQVEFTNYGGLTGANLSSGKINYVSGALSLTFTGNQSGPLTAKWTGIEDGVSGSYGQNNPYTGYGPFGDSVNNQSGYVTGQWSRISGPLSMLIEGQCNANSAEVQSTNNATNATGIASMNAKTDNLLGVRFPTLANWDPLTPILVTSYERDTGGSGIIPNGCDYFAEQYVGHSLTNGVTLGPRYWGGEMWGSAVWCFGTYLCFSPHATIGSIGGQREGREYGYAIPQAQSGNSTHEPYITGANFDGCTGSGTTGCDFTKIDITFSLPNGATSLATCGTNQSGGSDSVLVGSPSGTNNCTVTTTNGAIVKGFRIGNTGSNSTLYDSYGIDIMNATSSSWNMVYDKAGTASNTFSCALFGTNGAITTVQCTNTGSWSWTSGNEYISYLAGAPFQDQGGVKTLTITNPGSGETNGTYHFTASGGTSAPGFTCIEPKIGITVAGNVITDAFINTPSDSGTGRGGACASTTTPTITISGTGGTPGTVTLTMFLPQDDINDVGEALYGNDGLLAYGGVNYEPGVPSYKCLTPFVVGNGTSSNLNAPATCTSP